MMTRGASFKSPFGDDLFRGGLVAIRRDLELARRYSLAWFAIACFDTLSLLPLEREYVWTAQWSFAKALFLLNRWGVLGLQIMMQTLEHVTVPPDPALISNGFPSNLRTEPTSSLTGSAPRGAQRICYGVLALRVYALYDCSRTILTVSAVSRHTTGVPIDETRPPTDPLFFGARRPAVEMPHFIARGLNLTGCGTLGHAQLPMPLYLSVWGAFLLIDAVVFALTVHKSLEITRTFGPVPIVRALVHQGVGYYSVLTAVHFVSVAIILQTAHPRLRALNTSASLVVMSLMASRLVLSLLARAGTPRAGPSSFKRPRRPRRASDARRGGGGGGGGRDGSSHELAEVPVSGDEQRDAAGGL
ncbi:hypothetical protein JCM11491_004135 [Sporobolomyces phaffii]